MAVCLKRACIALWLLACLIHGCQTANAQTYKIIVDVQSCGTGGCIRADQYGSAACVGKIDGEYIFVTAGHNFYNLDKPAFAAASKPIKARIVDAGGSQYDARIIAYSTHTMPNDLAYVGLRTNQTLSCFPIAEQLPPPGADITVYGFPSGDKYNAINGTVAKVQPITIRESQTLGFIPRTVADFAITPEVVGGISGAPVIYKGQLVGIVSHSGSGDTIAGGAPRIRSSLLRCFQRLPDCGAQAPVPLPQTPAPESPPPQQPAPAPECDCDALKAKILALESELTDLKNKPPVKPEHRVLYFTSRNHPGVTETDVLARKLKDRGFPITIITLGPEEIRDDRVRDVPRIHELPSGKSVIGKGNVTVYLSALTI